MALIELNQGSASALEVYCWTADSDAGGKPYQIWHEASSQRVDSVRCHSYSADLYIYRWVSDGKGVMAYVNGEEYPGRPSEYGPITYNLGVTEGARSADVVPDR
ncbi:hypothetical protein AB0F13_12670 [Streptomyces sp. NPDC026206]|uniref:hypothetical protein n=1 Tax=Streptomyces sp. NPDC026206 TaxID=3157089 RepID=UPI0033E8105E